MKKIIIPLVSAFACSAYAVIPGYGLNYGKGNTYVYNEYNCSTHDAKDQFFLSFLEYGVTDWFDVQAQTVNYPDGSYNDLSLGGCLQFWKSDWLNLRGGAMYDFGNRAPNDKADSICYSLTGSGEIWNGLGYIYQMQCVHACHAPVDTPDWYQQVYLTYNVTEDIVPYVSLTTSLREVDRTTDFSVGGWYTVLRDGYGLQWVTIYVDVANLTEKNEYVRVSAGFDVLF